MNAKWVMQITREAGNRYDSYTEIVALGLEGEIEIYRGVWQQELVNAKLKSLTLAEQEKYINSLGWRLVPARFYDVLHCWDKGNQPKERCKVIIQGELYEYFPAHEAQVVKDSPGFYEISDVTFVNRVIRRYRSGAGVKKVEK